MHLNCSCTLKTHVYGYSVYLFNTFFTNLSVADNHQFLHEAYVSDKLIKDIHKLLRLHQKGIPLDKFVPAFEVSIVHVGSVSAMFGSMGWGNSQIGKGRYPSRGIDYGKGRRHKMSWFSETELLISGQQQTLIGF